MQNMQKTEEHLLHSQTHSQSGFTEDAEHAEDVLWE